MNNRFKLTCLYLSALVVLPLTSYLLYQDNQDTREQLSRTTYLAVHPGDQPAVLDQIIAHKQRCINDGTCSKDHCTAYRHRGPNATGDANILQSIERCAQSPGPSPGPSGGSLPACLAVAATTIVGFPEPVPMDQCIHVPVRLQADGISTHGTHICRAPGTIPKTVEGVLQSAIGEVGKVIGETGVAKCLWNAAGDGPDDPETCALKALADSALGEQCPACADSDTGAVTAPDPNDVAACIACIADKAALSASFDNFTTVACNGGTFGAFAEDDPDAGNTALTQYDRTVGLRVGDRGTVLDSQSVSNIGEFFSAAGVDTTVHRNTVRGGLIVAVVLSAIIPVAAWNHMRTLQSTVTVGTTTVAGAVVITPSTTWYAVMAMYWTVGALFWSQVVENVWQSSTGGDDGILVEDTEKSYAVILTYYLGIVNFIAAAMWTLGPSGFSLGFRKS